MWPSVYTCQTDLFGTGDYFDLVDLFWRLFWPSAYTLAKLISPFGTWHYFHTCQTDLFVLETIFSSFVELPAPESVELLESLGEDVNSWSFTVNLTTCTYQITIKNLNLKLKNSVETGVYFLGNFPKVYGNQVLVFDLNLEYFRILMNDENIFKYGNWCIIKVASFPGNSPKVSGTRWQLFVQVCGRPLWWVMVWPALAKVAQTTKVSFPKYWADAHFSEGGVGRSLLILKATYFSGSPTDV